MKKKRTVFRKILAITLSLSLVVATLMISAPHFYAADSVEFLMDGSKRIGIKNLVLDDINYYDINGGKSSVDDLLDFELFQNALLAENARGNSAAKLWANIASLVFESAGTDFGYNDDGFSSNYDEWFTQEGSESTSRDLNVIAALSSNDTWNTSRRIKSGFQYATSLSEAQAEMVEQIKELCDDGKVDRSAIIKYSTGRDEGFEALESTDEQTVIYNVATAYQRHSLKAYYSSFGIAYYDFELVPLTDDKLEFITAAEGYDSLEAAQLANEPGIEYYDTGSGNPHTSYVTNPSTSDTTVSASYSETNSTTISNHMESSETYTFGQNTEISTEFSASFPLVTEAKTSITVGFSAEQAISTAYGEEKSLTNETTTETVAEVNLPAHTQMGITQQTGKAEIKFDYDCPVYLTYKVAIFAMHGELYFDKGLIISWDDSYDQGGMCVVFGSDNTRGGFTAIDNLYNRAIEYSHISNYEKTYGNVYGYWECQGDGKPERWLETIDWSSFLNQKQKNGTATAKECIEQLKNNIPLSAAGGSMSVASSSMTTDITSIMPLYDLNYVQADGNSVYTIAPGGTVDFSKIATCGYNEHNIPYYGYIADGGEWVLCDADGNELTAVDGVTLTDVGNYQKLTADKVGTYYAKFLIDETLYDKVDSSGKITSADLSSTAIVTINVTETGLDHICTEGPWETTVNPTCTTEGEQVAKCMACGRIMYTQTVDKLDHIPVTITTPATCTAEGSIKNICGVCLGLISSETTEKLEHDEGVWKIDFEATADHHGQMSRYCTMCDTALESKEFELHTHQFGYESITREPTCVSNGEKGMFCGICNVMYATEQIEKTEHVPGGWKILKDSSCTQEGLMQQTCAICDALLEESEVIPMHDHNEGAWKTVLEATCNISGEKVKECTICGGTLETEEIPSHGHEAVWLTVKEADCKTTGREENTCTICNAILETRAIEKTEHIPGNWETVTDATCELDGEKQQDCSICGCLLSTKAIPAHGHAAAWITVKEADCKTTGREEYVCTICDAVLETREIAKTEHIPGKWEITQQPTCTQSGLMQQTCAICGALIGEPVVIDAHDHDNGAWRTVLEATCTTDGERIKECTICKGTIESEVIPALGHDDGVWTTALEASCETQGERHKNCTRCGQLIESERIDALGHTPGPEMTCATDQVCLVCEEVLVPADGKSHTWTEWETYKEAKFFTEEQQRRVCTSCDLEEYRFVKGTSKCHKYFPHCDGSGEDCWACNTLSNTNGFFRNLGRFIVWFFTENIISIILFPFAHGHFHEHINLDEIFGSK